MCRQKFKIKRFKLILFASRLRGLFLRRINRLAVLVDAGQFWNHNPSDLNTNKKKLLIVAPGNMPIPTVGWGAVETVIAESLDTYSNSGFDVWVINSKSRKLWREAKKMDFPIVLSHSDIDNHKIRSCFPKAKIVGVSHYGLGAYPEIWDKGFRKILKGMESCDFVVCLSDEIAVTFSKFISREKILVSPNGSDFQSSCDNPRQYKRLICLGKVERRKKQFELWQSLRFSDLEITFAGPIVDERVLYLLAEQPSLSNTFIGPISRQELKSELGRYSALILISSGEADALVLYEAQLAGLPVLVSKNSLGSQDSAKDWIKVISDHPTAEEIQFALSQVTSNASIISEFALQNYNWRVRNRRLVSLLLDLSRQAQRK